MGEQKDMNTLLSIDENLQKTLLVALCVFKLILTLVLVCGIYKSLQII